MEIIQLQLLFPQLGKYSVVSLLLKYTLMSATI
jgi:hypothetical protein